MVHKVQIFHICHISQVFVAFPLQTFSTIFMEFLPLSFENSRNFLPVIIIWMYCVKAPYAPDRLLEFSLLPSSMCYDKDLRSTQFSCPKKKKKVQTGTRGTVFGASLVFFPNALHPVLLSCVSLNAIVKSGWVGLKLGVSSDFDHRGSSKCSQTRRHGCEMTRMND